MNDTQLQKYLYTILQGRWRILRSGLDVYIEEPSRQLLYDSFEIYEQAYEEAYLNGVYVDDEVKLILLEQDIWSPLGERELKRKRKSLDDEKVNAFHHYYKPKELNFIKRRIKFIEEEMTELFHAKMSMDHLTCNGVADHARWHWIISHSTFNTDGTPYEWGKYSLSGMLSFYRNEAIDASVMRKIANNDPWRSIWLAGKKMSNIFGVPTIDLTKDQITLCRVSAMFDSVYENPDCPADKVIEDEDCLDGWFVVQRRKHEKDKKAAEADQVMTNPKIRDASEVFVMARDKEDAEQIYGLNDPLQRGYVKQRSEVIRNAEGQVSELEFADVKTNLQLQQNQQFVNKVKGG